MRKKVYGFSNLRVIACIAIVFLHTFYLGAGFYDAPAGGFVLCMCLRNLMMWAVPCFVMVSGALLLDPGRNVTYSKIFSNYIPRMAVALVFFTFVFEIMDEIISGDISFLSVLKNALYKIYTNTSWSHMWYLYLMIALYLMLPLYRKVAAGLTRKDAIYILSLLFVFQSVIPLVENFVGVETGFYICVYTVYTLYLFAGFILHNKLIDLPRYVFICAFAGGLVLTCAITAIGAMGGHEALLSSVGNFSNPFTGLAAAGLFGIVSGIDFKEHKFITSFDNCTFGIYLIHMAVLKVIFVRFKFSPLSFGGVISLVPVAILVTLISYGIVWVFKLILTAGGKM